MEADETRWGLEQAHSQLRFLCSTDGMPMQTAPSNDIASQFCSWLCDVVAWAGKNRPLDDDELQFMNELLREEAEKEYQKRRQEEAELEEFRKVRESRLHSGVP